MKAAREDEVLHIPEKLYFKIGEVARIVGVEPYVLRYWETEFPDLAPPKSRGNQRLYRRKDIERVFKIKTLLYRDKFTIEGARKWLEGKASAVALPVAFPTLQIGPSASNGVKHHTDSNKHIAAAKGKSTSSSALLRARDHLKSVLKRLGED
jgi:DNA-binding transcriptional MerR regulator